MGSLDSFRYDTEKETGGRWWEDYRGHGIDLLVARWNNPEHRKCLADLARKAREDLDEDEKITDETWESIQAESMARTIWKGARHLDEGEYTVELGIATLSDPSFSQFREDIAGFALEDDAYLARAVGNSEAASVGS